MDPQNQPDPNNNTNPTTPITTSSGTFSAQNAQEVTPNTNPTPAPISANIVVNNSIENLDNTAPIPELTENPTSTPPAPPTPTDPETTPPNPPVAAPPTLDQNNLSPNSALNPFDEKSKKPHNIKTLLIPALVVLILILILGAGFLFFKNRTPQNSNPLTMWGFEDSAIWQPILANYQSKTGIKVTYTKINKENYENTLLEAFVTKTSPDIFPLRSDWYQKHSNKIIPNTENLGIPEYYPYAKSILFKNNSQLGVALAQDSLALYINKDLNNKTPLTELQYWDQIKDWVPSATLKTGNTINTSALALGYGSNVEHSADILSTLMLQNQATMTSADNSVSYDQMIQKTGTGDYLAGKEALEFITNFAKPDQPNYTWNNTLPNSLVAFGTGKAITYIGYAQDISTIKDKYPLLNFEVAPLPQIRNSELNLSLAQFWSLSVSKDSASSENAWKLLQHIAQSDNIKQLDIATKMPSPYPSVSATENDPNLTIFEAQSKTATSWNKYDQAKLDSYLVSAINEVTDNNSSAKLAVETASKRSNDFIQANINSHKPNPSVGDKTLVRIWTLNSDDPNLKNLITTYINTDPDLNKYFFQITPVKYEDLENRFLEDTASDIGPDLVFIPQDIVPAWKNRLAPYFSDSNKFGWVKNNVLPAQYTQSPGENKLLGLSLYKNILAMAYNFNILNIDHNISQPAQTWNDLTLTQISQITKKNGANFDVSTIALGADNVRNASDLLSLMMLQYNTQMTSSDKSKPTFYLPDSNNSYPAQKALDFYRSFSNSSSPNYTWNNNGPDDFTQFKNGKLAYLFIYYSEIAELTVNPLPFSISYAPVPQMSVDGTPIDLAKNIVATIPKRNHNGPVVSNILWHGITNITDYSSDTLLPNPLKNQSDTTKRVDVQSPFNQLGVNAVELYKGGYPVNYNNTMLRLIKGEITLTQAGELISANWK